MSSHGAAMAKPQGSVLDGILCEADGNAANGIDQNGIDSTKHGIRCDFRC